MSKTDVPDLDSVLASIAKKHGEGAVQRMGDWKSEPVEAISTGSLRLDKALGVGGFPRGRIVEMYGNPSSGKSTLALHAIANAQMTGLKAAYVDAEHALDPDYARALGVDVENLYLCQPESGEQGLDIALDLIKSNLFAIVVVDSVAALVPRAELEGDIGDAHMGLQARMMGQALRKMTGVASKTSTCVIFINQLRQKLGLVFGNPNTTPGGKALPFFASVRIEVSRTGSDKDGTEVVGNKTKAKVVKNKCAPPFKEAEFDIIFGEGVNQAGEIVDDAVAAGVIKKSGAWYVYGEDMKCQGRSSACEFVRQNPDVRDEIRKALV